MMTRLMLIAGLVCLLGGCVWIEYDKARYVRFGDQSLEALAIERTDEGVTRIELGKQDAEATALESAIRLLDRTIP